MIIHHYKILGMFCGSCADSIKSKLLKLEEIREVIVQIAEPQAIIKVQEEIPLNLLQSALDKAGNYTIMRVDKREYLSIANPNTKSWIATYQPIVIIGAYITGLTFLIEATRGNFNIENWMTNFMSGFFLVCSFFKFLDLKGFADAYYAYDILAKRWYNWSYVYVFIELGLGLAYMLKFNLLITDIITLLIMLFGSWGVLESIFNKRQIKCACLGTIFHLPMGTLTVIENVMMICMSVFMLILKFFKN